MRIILRLQIFLHCGEQHKSRAVMHRTGHGHSPALPVEGCHWKHLPPWIIRSYLCLTSCPCSCATTVYHIVSSSPPNHTKENQGNADTNRPAEFYWKNNLSPPSQPWLKQALCELRLLIQEKPQTSLWPARGSTSAADIATFQAMHGGFLCSWTSQRHFLNICPHRIFTFIQLLEDFPLRDMMTEWSRSAPRRRPWDSLHHSSLPFNSNLNHITVKACVPWHISARPRLGNTVCVCLYSVRRGVVINPGRLSTLPLLQAPNVCLPPKSKGLDVERGSFLLRC